jgi:hypothetical protein
MRPKLEFRALMLVLFVLLPFSASAQTTTPAPVSPPAATTTENLLKPPQLDAMVAPIALYPDDLLAQIMMASTYPLEVVQAERWLSQNKDLKGDALKQAVEKLTWDDSVKSLLATPSVITMMSKKLDWTQKLGDAVLAQEGDVMDAVQRLRGRAQSADKLKTTKEQNVAVQQQDGKQVIAISSANPETVYVPYYDPAVVYGTWPYPEYPAEYYYPDDYWLPGGVIAAGIAFGAGYAAWRWWDHWRPHVDWHRRDIDINRNGRVEHWRHNPQHRHGVAYNNPKVRQQFAGTTQRPGDRAKAGQRPAGGAKAGDRTKQAGKQAGQGKQAAKGTKTAKGKGSAQGKKAAQGKGAGKKSAQAKRPSQAKSSQARRSAQSSRSSQARRAAQRPTQRSSQRTVARVQRQSFSPRAGRSFGGGGRSFGGGGFRGGGRGGGRRSDIRLKHDIVLLGRLGNGLGWYRFAYQGGTRTYVGVMAQEVQKIAPAAVMRGRDGYLSVDYNRLGLKFQTYDEWRAKGHRIPATAAVAR